MATAIITIHFDDSPAAAPHVEFAFGKKHNGDKWGTVVVHFGGEGDFLSGLISEASLVLQAVFSPSEMGMADVTPEWARQIWWDGESDPLPLFSRSSSAPPFVGTPVTAAEICPVVKDHMDRHGNFPDFAARTPVGIRKAHNYIISVWGFKLPENLLTEVCKLLSE